MSNPLLRFGVLSFFSCLSLSFVHGQESKPASWDEFMDFHVTSGAFGTFQAEGVTKGMWEGIEAGQKYTATYTLEPDVNGKSIHTSHRMETEGGDVISIGAGLQYWDAKSESVLASYSGFDQGSLFTGSSVLKTFDPKAARIEWIYTEVSHGKTTEYLQRIEQVSSKVKTQASSKLEGGDEWVESLTRAPANRLKIRVRPRMPRVLQRVDGR